MYYFRQLTAKDLGAKTLILSLLSATNSDALHVNRAIASGELFGIGSSAIRVAIARLLKQEMLKHCGRGVYLPGPRSEALTQQLRGWQIALDKTAAWSGGWLAVFTHHAGRTNKTALRARTRALGLNGYTQVETDFWVRPANLKADLKSHREALVDLGLGPEAIVLQISDVAPDRAIDWPNLWSKQALARSYEAALGAMEGSIRKLPAMTPEAAALETLLVGQSVIQTINFDPLLPGEIGCLPLFEGMVQAMKRYNDIGDACWGRFFSKIKSGQPQLNGGGNSAMTAA